MATGGHGLVVLANGLPNSEWQNWSGVPTPLQTLAGMQGQSAVGGLPAGTWLPGGRVGGLDASCQPSLQVHQSESPSLPGWVPLLQEHSRSLEGVSPQLWQAVPAIL